MHILALLTLSWKLLDRMSEFNQTFNTDAFLDVDERFNFEGQKDKGHSMTNGPTGVDVA